MRVDFMIIGAMKCGTTTLAQRLAAHRQVSFSTIKEPCFFNERSDWREKIDRYHRLFDPVTVPGGIYGEGSTLYTRLPHWPETPGRLHEYNPDLKLIYMMRHPVERIVSHYAHRAGHGYVVLPPEEEVLSEGNYLNTSRYAMQLRPYVELFGRERIHLIVFEEFVADLEAGLREVAEFLGIEEDGFSREVQWKRQNPSEGQLRWGPRLGMLRKREPWRTFGRMIPRGLRETVKASTGVRLEKKPEFSTELKRRLWDELEEDVVEVERLVGRRVVEWRATG